MESFRPRRYFAIFLPSPSGVGRRPRGSRPFDHPCCCLCLPLSPTLQVRAGRPLSQCCDSLCPLWCVYSESTRAAVFGGGPFPQGRWRGGLTCHYFCLSQLGRPGAGRGSSTPLQTLCPRPPLRGEGAPGEAPALSPPGRELSPLAEVGGLPLPVSTPCSREKTQPHLCSISQMALEVGVGAGFPVAPLRKCQCHRLHCPLGVGSPTPCFPTPAPPPAESGVERGEEGGCPAPIVTPFLGGPFESCMVLSIKRLFGLRASWLVVDA